MATAGVYHALAFCGVHGHGLLAEHVLAMLCRFNGVDAMQKDRSGKINRINFRIGKNLGWIRNPLGNAMALLEFKKSRGLLS
jgi:hypothetical protein